MTGLMDLLNAAIGRGVETAKQKADEPLETVSTTVRFSGDLRRFLEAQAEAWGGVTVQSVVTTILNGTMHETLGQRRNGVDIVASRILKLFDLHKIDIVTAAEILDVPFSDMKPDRLITHVNNLLIDNLCDLFSVSRGWLLGQVNWFSAKELSWDRSPATAAERILERAREGLKPRVYFLKSRSWDLDKALKSDSNGMRMPVVLELHRKTPSGREFLTYERLESLPWEYERCRTDILALVMFCQNMYSDKHETVARKLGLKSDHFLPWDCSFSWTDLAIQNNDAFEQFTQGLILPSQLLSTPGMNLVFGLEDYIDLPGQFPGTPKNDPQEVGRVIEKYNKTIKCLADGITRDREFKERQEKWRNEPDGVPEAKTAEVEPETQPAAE